MSYCEILYFDHSCALVGSQAYRYSSFADISGIKPATIDIPPDHLFRLVTDQQQRHELRLIGVVYMAYFQCFRHHVGKNNQTFTVPKEFRPAILQS